MIVPELIALVHEPAGGAVGGRVGVRVRAGRGRLAFAAADRAEDEAAPGQERASEQRRSASVAAEAAVRGVPVLALVRHLTCISHYEQSDGLQRASFKIVFLLLSLSRF